jgi:hypothetical protein
MDLCYTKAPSAVRRSTCSICSLSVYRFLVSSSSKLNNRGQIVVYSRTVGLEIEIQFRFMPTPQLGKDLVREDSSCVSCAETPESYQPCQRTEGIYSMLLPLFSINQQNIKSKIHRTEGEKLPKVFEFNDYTEKKV